MKNLFLTFCLFILASYSYAQKTISVLSGTTWTFYEDFSTALRQAPSGATIYLPGGIINSLSGYDTIKKPLTIIGVGHFPDSTTATQPTIIISNIILEPGAAFSSIIGLEVRGDIYLSGNGPEITNINIMRCKIYRILDWFSTGIVFKNTIISECVITDFYVQNFGVNNLVEKSIINFAVGQGNVLFRNNIIFQIGIQFGDGLQGCTLENNILGIGDFIYSCLVQNNLILNGILNNSNQLLAINNIYSTYANTFMNVPSGIYDITYNYHLKPTSNAKSAGTDGTDIGIYGTSRPCKEGWVPPNPHVSFKSIPSESLPTGTLPVNVKVVAQDR
ncbi:MAG: hypothetical protein IPP60_08795 [Sphingobacteriales bacterium]|nr:hypothetical protein [Sphingobacteriales bacterium]